MPLLTQLVRLFFLRRLREIDRFRSHPAEVQQLQLQKLLRQASATAFGKEYRFDEIRDGRQFGERIPVTDYAAFGSYIDRIRRGENNVTWPTDIRWFAKSSGTTASKSMWQPRKRPSVISRLEAAQEYRKKENQCYQVLCGYFHLLQDWKERYAPQPSDEEWHPLFCEALQKIDYVEFLLDGLIFGTLEERTAIVKEKEKELDRLERRIAGFSVSGVTEPHRNGIPKKAQGMHCLEELAM